MSDSTLTPAQPTPDPFNRKQVEAVCRAVCKVEGVDPDDDTFGDGCDPVWTRYADAVADALAAQPPAAPVETEEGSLIDRLRNPMWAHSTAPFLGPQLEQEENLAAMTEAANEIERLEKKVALSDNLLIGLTSVVEGLKAELAETSSVCRSSAETVQAKHDHRVYFMCECCHDCDPENGVSCREDIAVMPDGTWLCDNCYSDCDKSEYGMVASDVDDFEFPRFEDLPRPMPYPGQQVIPGLPQSVEVTDAMVSAGLDGWFSIKPTDAESDAVLERSMRAALTAALALSRPHGGVAE